LVSCNLGYTPSGNTCVPSSQTGTCTDRTQNNGETGVDCGGPCIDCVLQADYYVAPNGNDNNPGTITQPWKTWQKAFSTAQAGDLVYFRGGVYPYSGNSAGGVGGFHSGTVANPIRFFNYPGEEPILDFSGLTVAQAGFQRAISVWSVSYLHFKGLTVGNSHHILYDGEPTYTSGIDAYKANHITFENMKVHDIDGPCFTINGCDEVHVINSDAWNCNDHLARNPGQNGVGFQSNNDLDFGEAMYNVHIYFEGCRTWNFSDNGFTAVGVGYAEWKNCWAFDGGALTGMGCGWKTGISDKGNTVNPLSRLVVNCISANNGAYGFSPNNNWGNIFNAHYYNNFAYYNGYKHYLLWWVSYLGEGFWITDYNGNTPAPNEMYSNNIAYANEYADVFEEKPYIHQYNSWDLPVTVSDADFVSLDVKQLYSPRNANGSLPSNITFGHLRAGSDLINKGVNVGLPYSGSAPDLGPFEYSGGAATCSGSNTESCTSMIANAASATRTRTCTNGVWGAPYGTCTVVRCNPNYHIVDNSCVIDVVSSSCTNRIKDGTETGIDCGGNCDACAIGHTYYVATNGNDNYLGTFEQPWATWQKAFSTAVAGDTVYFRGGTYYYTTVNAPGVYPEHSGTVGNYINFFNYPDEIPILDFSNLNTAEVEWQRGISVFSKSYIKFRGLTVRNLHQNPYAGNYNYASGIGTWYSNHIYWENINTYNIQGVGQGAYGSDEVYYKNCDSWNNNDRHSDNPGQNGVGFGVSTNPADFGEKMYNSHIYFEGCRAWNFSDNGFAITGVGYAETKNCWAFDGGALTGEGCGWKTGVSSQNDAVNPLSRLIVNCISANNGHFGFSPNNYNQGNTFNAHYYNNFAYHNGYKHYLTWWAPEFGNGFEMEDYKGNTPAPNEMYSNNIAYDNEHADVFVENGKPYIHQYNSWDLPVTVTDADFVSLDVSQLYRPRKPDGSLPDITFGHLKAGSDLIDKGVNVGLTQDGEGNPIVGLPDLGAFEYQ
jgi:hypothetical protein